MPDRRSIITAADRKVVNFGKSAGSEQYDQHWIYKEGPFWVVFFLIKDSSNI